MDVETLSNKIQSSKQKKKPTKGQNQSTKQNPDISITNNLKNQILKSKTSNNLANNALRNPKRKQGGKVPVATP